MGIFDEQLDFRDLLRSTIIQFYKEYIKVDPWLEYEKDYQIIVHNLYKSGVNANNLNKYILWTKTNHESKIVNIYIKIRGSYMRDSNGFPVLNKRGTDLITLDKIIEYESAGY